MCSAHDLLLGFQALLCLLRPHRGPEQLRSRRRRIATRNRPSVTLLDGAPNATSANEDYSLVLL